MPEHASEPSILEATEEEVRSGYVGRQLREFNYGFVGEYPEQRSIRLNAKDGGGKVVGGVRAYVFLYWLQIDVLWVAEGARGQGLGTRLLSQAEARAMELGARNVKLETFEWQARDFYLKQGYEEFARIDHYASDYYLAFMKKTLR
ncbi:GNAT family N-acetyltransferase [Variovorax rhizosphaerae]|uniref:GNAT family N-acetyltransferase n=1 Tax=Variovorax rhizosphaerae TaxID=1836200 RepID=A0ABU8WN57_9BURK